MIGAVLPEGVEFAESYGDLHAPFLFPAERNAIRNAGEKRRREYATVRHCARQALARLGRPPAPILSGEGRDPQWPPGIVGSMTHSDGYRAAALAHDSRMASLGIDAERHAPLPARMLRTIATPDECRQLAELGVHHPEVHWDCLVFSAKESVYKAWYPLARRWLGFGDVSLDIDPVARHFTVRSLRPDREPAGGHDEQSCGLIERMSGAWCVEGELIVTSVVIGH